MNLKSASSQAPPLESKTPTGWRAPRLASYLSGLGVSRRPWTSAAFPALPPRRLARSCESISTFFLFSFCNLFLFNFCNLFFFHSIFWVCLSMCLMILCFIPYFHICMLYNIHHILSYSYSPIFSIFYLLTSYLKCTTEVSVGR